MGISSLERSPSGEILLKIYGGAMDRQGLLAHPTCNTDLQDGELSLAVYWRWRAQIDVMIVAVNRGWGQDCRRVQLFWL